MFRYKPSIHASYEQQGYIYFVSRMYQKLPPKERAEIERGCNEAAGNYGKAVQEYVTTGTSAEAICAKHFISRSTLDRAVRRYYEEYAKRIS